MHLLAYQSSAEGPQETATREIVLAHMYFFLLLLFFMYVHTYMTACMSFACTCVWCMHIYAHACESQRSSGITYHSSTLFIEAGSLSNPELTDIWLVFIVSRLPLRMESGGLSCPPGIYPHVLLLEEMG